MKTKFLHGPVALEKAGREGCIVCHIPTEKKCSRSSGGRFTIMAEMPDLCHKCHDLAVSKRHPTMIGGCALCHNPHGTDSGPPFLVKGMGLGRESGKAATGQVKSLSHKPGTLSPPRKITGLKRQKVKIYRDETYEQEEIAGLSEWGVRAKPSKKVRRSLQREKVKKDLESPAGVVHRLMSDSDRETLTTYLEFQRNLKKAGRPVFRLKRWTNKESNIIYEVRLEHTEPVNGAEALWCSRAGLSVDMGFVEDPDLRKMSREMDTLFCRHPDRSWRLERPGKNADKARKPE